MGRRIKRPALSPVSPPYFEIGLGHQVKVIAMNEALWVELISVEGDDLLGIVPSRDTRSELHDLGRHDVIEFKRCHVFGLF